MDAGTPAGGFWSHKKALLAPARVFGSRAYLGGGAGQKDRKNPEKVEKVKKKVFFLKHLEFPHDSGKITFFGFLDRFDPLLAILLVYGTVCARAGSGAYA